jgi:DNA-binding FadR family transcriptional regulator
VDLNTNGLVQIIPRRGVYVSNYRRSSSLSILSSLLPYHNGKLDISISQSLIDMRLIVESESARLAALNRTSEQLADFHDMLRREQDAFHNIPQALTNIDFLFHLSVAIALGNLDYPLIINSFKGVYINQIGMFFRRYCGTQVVEAVLQFHVKLVNAFDNLGEDSAKGIMI